MQQWEPKQIEDLTGIEGIECGYYTSCAYKKDSAYIWGEDAFQLTDYNIIRDKYVLDINNIKEISMGRNHMVVRTLNQIFGYGSNSFGQMGDKKGAEITMKKNIKKETGIDCCCRDMFGWFVGGNWKESNFFHDIIPTGRYLWGTG